MSPHKDAVLRKSRALKPARHEAAHAVMAEMLGHTVVEVVLESQGAGHCKHHARGMQPDPLALGMIISAGHAAEVLWHRRPRTVAPKEDHQCLTTMGFRGRSLSTLLSMSMNALQMVEPMVFAVAKELQKRDLTGSDVRDIINGCKDRSARDFFIGACAESA